jgi:hypothetical protein
VDIWPPIEAIATVVAAVTAGGATLLARSAAGRSDSAAERANSAADRASNAAELMANIERERRHTELTPQLRVTCRHLNPGVDGLRMRVALLGPPGLDQLAKLTVRIRDDHHRRGEGTSLAGGPTREQIQRQIWGPYRLSPGVGPDNAQPDPTGRSIVYDGILPVGEELPFPLEPTRPPSWSTGATPASWLHDIGTVIRVEFLAEHALYGTWRLPAEIDTVNLDNTTTTEVVVYVPTQ